MALKTNILSKQFLGNIESFNYNTDDFEGYLNSLIHEWLAPLTALVFGLVPIFFILDYFTMPRELLLRFGIFRAVSTFIAIAQLVILKNTKPSKYSFYHAYVVSLNVGGIIALMTTWVGGFNSSYYAGLNLLIIGVNLLIPWSTIHSALNSGLIIFLYILFNFAFKSSIDPSIVINNFFFLCSTAIVAVIITAVRHRLVRQEFSLLVQLKRARDALWSEMELAKRIQTALLPEREKIKGFDIAAAMHPAREVGGDYYDIIESKKGVRWITMGDVSGHGVDSGLIMMMAQTSIISMVKNCADCKPSTVLKAVNTVIRENLSRLGSDHYMTITAIRISENVMSVSGKHQDIIIFRSNKNRIEIIPSRGTWLGIADKTGHSFRDRTIKLNPNDIMLLYTDGIIEATNDKGEMYGEERLAQVLNQYADLSVRKILDKIVGDVNAFQEEQHDDMTLIVIKKT